jgi:hypothetical protein
MAIQLSKKQSDLEKRLKILHNQVYGKSQSSAISYQLSDKNKSGDRRLTTESYSDVVFLQKDLLKILILSSLAIGSQIILYFLLQKHIVNLNFF